MPLDAMGFAFGVMAAEWAKEEDRELALYGAMQRNRLMRLPPELLELVARW